MGAEGDAEVERFRRAIAERVGLQVDDARLGDLAAILERRLRVRRLTADRYLTLFPADRGEVTAVSRELTVSETYFFRHLEQLAAFVAVVLPDHQRKNVGRPLRILSIGCASGEEPFTLAMLMREAGVSNQNGSEAAIVGIDLNGPMIEKAKQGLYSPWSLRETPQHHRQRWFRAEGRAFALSSELRAEVRFEERNVLEDDPDFWRTDGYDVVFCRNVLMYFGAAQAQLAVERIARSIVRGGFLFLGHAENLRGLSSDFHLRHTNGAFFYQRKLEAEGSEDSDSGTEVFDAVKPGSNDGDDWIDAVRRASDRVTVLTGSPDRAPATAGPDATWDLSSTLELIRRERFGEALSSIKGLPGTAEHDPDVMLLRATLLTHRGELVEAERACHRLLAANEMSAGGHYLLALCREGVGDSVEAAQHDRVAVYLDPGFAMPRLHLGLLARRAGDLATAGRELREALTLIEREDPSRLLLFGGGFGREALIALCRAELARCGGVHAGR